MAFSCSDPPSDGAAQLMTNRGRPFVPPLSPWHHAGFVSSKTQHLWEGSGEGTRGGAASVASKPAARRRRQAGITQRYYQRSNTQEEVTMRLQWASATIHSECQPVEFGSSFQLSSSIKRIRSPAGSDQQVEPFCSRMVPFSMY